MAVKTRKLKCRIRALAAIARYTADFKNNTTLYMDEPTYNKIEDKVNKMNYLIMDEKIGFIERNCLVKVSAKNLEVSMTM